ncbi:hypothetical protein AGLY_007905 [Aphis glycines]|uniref:Uncharacterized protein n=1 Tax=Aphis glycines TaxID=307491 RepID=A0A6G0TP83_APHGL|nr:hypothetical protein AGLY_007905 [Aphis glycines]
MDNIILFINQSLYQKKYKYIAIILFSLINLPAFDGFPCEFNNLILKQLPSHDQSFESRTDNVEKLLHHNQNLAKLLVLLQKINVAAKLSDSISRISMAGLNSHRLIHKQLALAVRVTIITKIYYDIVLKNVDTHQSYTQQFQIDKNNLLYFQPFINRITCMLPESAKKSCMISHSAITRTAHTFSKYNSKPLLLESSVTEITVNVNTSPPDLIRSTTCLCVDPSTFTLFLNIKHNIIKNTQNSLSLTLRESCLLFGSLRHTLLLLRRSVELTIYTLKLTTLTNLATNVKSETSDALCYRDFTRTRRYFRRHCPLTLHYLNEQ